MEVEGIPHKGRQIVTIDISNFEQRKHDIANQILNASKDVGFFYIGGAFLSLHDPGTS